MGHLSMSRDTLDCHKWKGGATALYWIEARDVVQYPTMHTVVLHNKELFDLKYQSCTGWKILIIEKFGSLGDERVRVDLYWGTLIYFQPCHLGWPKDHCLLPGIKEYIAGSTKYLCTGCLLTTGYDRGTDCHWEEFPNINVEDRTL